jgi:ubiquinone/menaquinone biosynthesis C-methylase UbiE
MPDREAALKEFARGLVPDGQLIVLEMTLSLTSLMRAFTKHISIGLQIVTRFQKTLMPSIPCRSIMNFPGPGHSVK